MCVVERCRWPGALISGSLGAGEVPPFVVVRLFWLGSLMNRFPSRNPKSYRLEARGSASAPPTRLPHEARCSAPNYPRPSTPRFSGHHCGQCSPVTAFAENSHPTTFPLQIRCKGCVFLWRQSRSGQPRDPHKKRGSFTKPITATCSTAPGVPSPASACEEAGCCCTCCHTTVKEGRCGSAAATRALGL